MFIRSERLFLRPAWSEDIPDLHAAISDQRVVSNLTSVAWPQAVEDARDFVNRPRDRRHPAFLITMPGARGSRIVGAIGLREDAEFAELVYWLAPEVWGRGFATEAARAVLRLAHTLGHREVRAIHFVDNPASGRVLSKLGFQPVGNVSMQYSHGRGCAAPAREYRSRLDGPGNIDGDPAPQDDGGMKVRAA